MTTQNRANEILSQITAFSKTGYTKAEYLPELMKLQDEVVNLTFNGEHAEEAKLRLWDVGDYFTRMNSECKGAADQELYNFIKGSKAIGNEISSELSGSRGEQTVFKTLENLSCYNTVLHNVELEIDGKRTEIDAIVFTHRAIFIIEIKNSKKNIFIDEDGEFYRAGHSMHYDCNIADKMSEREFMLRKILDKVGLGYLKIFNIVTFTNPRIDVENKYHRIKVCGSNYLPTFIEKFYSDNWYTDENIGTMVTAVEDAKCKDPFQMPVNVDDFKTSFAYLMATLESAREAVENESAAQQGIDKESFVEEPIAEEQSVKDVLESKPNKKDQSIPTSQFKKRIIAASVGFVALNIAALGIGALLKGTR